MANIVEEESVENYFSAHNHFPLNVVPLFKNYCCAEGLSRHFFHCTVMWPRRLSHRIIWQIAFKWMRHQLTHAATHTTCYTCYMPHAICC